MTRSLLFLAPILLAAACANEGNPDDQPNPNPQPDPEVEVSIAGTYEVNSHYDLSQSPDLPDVVSDLMGPLASLSGNPAQAIIEALSESNSDLADLLDDLPSALHLMLENKINEFILQSEDATELIAKISSFTDMLMDFEVLTELQVGTLDQAGNANANHSLVALAFTRDGDREVIEAPEVLSQLSIARDVSVNYDDNSQEVSIGDHAFQIPLGDFLGTAFDSFLASQGIPDLGAALADAVNCEGLAADVGDVCIDSFCILSEGDIQSFCEEGMDSIAQKVEDKILDFEFARLRMMGGQATIEASQTEVGGMTGEWNSEFGIDERDMAIPSQFAASRSN